MTAKQHRWYLREWGAAFGAHWAGVRSGEVVARSGRPDPHPLREQILAIARRMLVTRGGKLDADCLRHSCHVHALGRDVPSMKMTNKQIDKVVAVFRQMAGVNLAAMMQSDAAIRESHRLSEDRLRKRANPCAPTPMPDADRARLVWAIEHVDLSPAYVEEISRDVYGTADWRTLPTGMLHKLRITLACRSAAKAISGTKRVNVTSTL